MKQLLRIIQGSNFLMTSRSKVQKENKGAEVPQCSARNESQPIKRGFHSERVFTKSHLNTVRPPLAPVSILSLRCAEVLTLQA